MKYVVSIILFFILFFVSAQEMEVKFINQFSLNADEFIGVDSFEDFYYTKGNTFYKKTRDQTYSYTNTQLGEVSSIDITNPLKIVLFYRDFNTIVILDNRLNELTDRINLTIATFAKNVAFASISSNNNLWLYSLDDNILSLWNYETKQTIFDTQPLSFYKDDFEAELQTSTYEYCWLVSKQGILQFNEYGSFINSVEAKNIDKIQSYLNGFIFLTNNKMFYNNNKASNEVIITDKKHKLDNFYITKDNLYFFDANVLYKYSFFKK